MPGRSTVLHLRALHVGAVALLVLGACSGSPSPPAPEESVEPSQAAGEAGLPSGCTAIDLRGPTGERVDLSGAWEKEGSAPGPATRWWIRQLGDCVWAVTVAPEFPEVLSAQPGDLQTLQGRLDPSFVVAAELVDVAPYGPGRVSIPFLRLFYPIRLLVEFDDTGQIHLREDREAGAQGPRCPDPAGYCPPPLALVRSPATGSN